MKNFLKNLKTKHPQFLKQLLTCELKKFVKNFISEFEATLDEEKEALATKLDEYLTYVVENWMKENQVAIDSGIRSDISESFMVGLKALFEEHYVTMPDAKYDLVEGLNNKIDDVEAKT